MAEFAFRERSSSHEGRWATFQVVMRAKGAPIGQAAAPEKGWYWETHEKDDHGGPHSTSKKAFDEADTKYQSY